MEENLKFFETLNLLSAAFKEATDPSNSQLPFEELLIKGYARNNNLQSHSKKLRMFANDLQKDKTLYYKILRTYATVFHRRELSVFFKELKDYIDIAKLDSDQTWQNIRNKILTPQEPLTDSQRERLLQVPSDKLLSGIRNSLMHNSSDKYVLDNFPDKLNSEFVKHYPIATMAPEYLFDVFYDNTLTNVNFHSYRLNRDLHLIINANTLKEIQLCCSNALKGEFAIKQDGLKENITNFLQAPNKLDYDFTISMLCGDEEKPYTFKKEEKLALETFYNSCEFQNGLNLHNSPELLIPIIASWVGSAPLIENSISPLRVYTTCFSAFISYEHLAHALSATKFVPKTITFNNIVNMLHQNLIEQKLWGNTSHSSHTKTDIHKMLQYNLRASTMYREILLTELVNMLEYFDSLQSQNHEVWKDFANNNLETFSAYTNPANHNNQEAAYHLIRSIRDSIVHLRYINNQDTTYFFDGVNNDELSLKATLKIQDIEKIRNAGFKYIQNLALNNMHAAQNAENQATIIP